MADLKTKRILAYVAVYLAIAAVSVLHYVAPVHAHHLHDIYRRLYYLPIILAAFLGGWRGGLTAAIIVCAAYTPHALGHISHDPATDTQKVLEMVLYLSVGTVTGGLVSRLTGTQRELRRSLQQLREAEAQVIRSAKLAAVGRLSAGLAHEIRNPLASIKGSAEILADDFPDGHPKHRLLRVLVEESSRLNQVLTRFLSFARPRPLAHERLNLPAELGSVIELLRAGQNEPRAAAIDLEGGPQRSVWLRGDREQLRQVFLNVLLNALQAAGDGGEVRVRWEVGPGAARVDIRDSGSGFTPEAIENAFTPFFTTKPQGTGLGLALSHRILESHGGSIRVGNHPDGGGRVELIIPLGEEDDAAHPADR